MAEPVTLTLSREEALVLFEWLHRFNDEEGHRFEDQAEERVLWNLEASLESRLVDLLKHVLPDPKQPVSGRPGAIHTADSGTGIVYQRPGATGNADMIRIMDPTPQYPSGYVRYYNQHGQPLDVFGNPGSRATTHIPLDYEGPIPVWPQ